VVRTRGAWAELLWATTVEPNINGKRINKQIALSRERLSGVQRAICALVFLSGWERTFMLTRILKGKW
jgi:hypothetical protein